MSERVDLSIQWQDHKGHWKVISGLTTEGADYPDLNQSIVRTAGPSDNLPWMVDVYVDPHDLKIVGTQPEQDWLEAWTPIPNQKVIHSHLLNQRLILIHADWEILWNRFAGWRGFRPADQAVTVYCETSKDVKNILETQLW